MKLIYETTLDKITKNKVMIYVKKNVLIENI